MPSPPPAHDGSAAADPRICRALLALGSHVDALTEAEWWLVELTCRQGMEVAVAAERIGVATAEAERMWRNLHGLVASPG